MILLIIYFKKCEVMRNLIKILINSFFMWKKWNISQKNIAKNVGKLLNKSNNEHFLSIAKTKK